MSFAGKLQTLKTKYAIPRADGVTDLQVILGFGGRFFDELITGLPDVLMPAIQNQLGLSLTQVAALHQILNYVAVVVEPISATLADLLRRKWLMGFGAIGMALFLILLGVAPVFWVLLLAYAIAGISSGPLAHTGDVVVVNNYPNAAERAFTRATMFDTIGALLAPLWVTLVLWLRLPWQWALYGVAGISICYALLILRTGFPLPAHPQTDEEGGLFSRLRQNILTVLKDSKARYWLLFLFLFDLLETPFILQTIWLEDVAGISQLWIGIYVALEMGVSFISLLVLDRLQQHFSSHQILQTTLLMVAWLVPAWLFIPGKISKFLLLIPMQFFFTFFWPLAKGESLASVPNKAGATTAIHSLFGLLPIPLLFGWLSDGIGLTPAMLITHLIAITLLSLLLFKKEV